jgi:hypothetical protein
MADIVPHRPILKRPENTALLEHWEALRGDAVAPQRSSFRPMDVPRHLPHLIMLEPDLPAKADIRIFGTELAHRLGYDLTGQNLFDLYESDRVHVVNELVTLVVEEHLVAVGYTDWTSPAGHVFTTENVWLPLISEHGKVTRLLGSFWELTAIDADIVSLGDSLDKAEGLSDRKFYRF